MGSPVSYMTSNIGWTFNFVVATIWFWAFGFTVVDKYGYSTTNDAVNKASGAIESGAYRAGTVKPLGPRRRRGRYQYVPDDEAAVVTIDII